ncbi:hypothetical protein ACJIZ3_016581 [Penstemon smallii]|uniref:Uncharacterized protein n=1 Tax=Penstemon smallii TaxID=265156 RepID=A0ABD3ST33_9LAMI
MVYLSFLFHFLSVLLFQLGFNSYIYLYLQLGH